MTDDKIDAMIPIEIGRHEGSTQIFTFPITRRVLHIDGFETVSSIHQHLWRQRKAFSLPTTVEDVSIGDDQIEPAVAIQIDRFCTKANMGATRCVQMKRAGPIDKSTTPSLQIEIGGLIEKIRDMQIDPSIA